MRIALSTLVILTALAAADAPVARDGFADTRAARAALVQQSRLIPDRSARTFGASAALSANGDVALVGAPLEGDHGAAYVFTRRNGRWSSTRLTARGGTFGASVALSGNGRVALVGDPGFDDGRGAARVFTRSGASWVLQATLRGRDRKGKASFGYSVALSADGSTALVGGPYDDRGRFDRLKPFVYALGGLLMVDMPERLTKRAGNGAAWLFARSGSTWRPMGGKITPRGRNGRAMFGFSVALSASGQRALVGAPNDSGGRGATWSFARSGAGWRQEARLPSRPGKLSSGWSVDLSGDGLVAVMGGVADGNYRGSALVAARSDGGWQLRQKLTGGRMFGYAVSANRDGTAVLVGAPGATGSVWLFTRFGEVLARRQLTGRGSGVHAFASVAALSEDGLTAVVGDAGAVRRRGAAWLYVDAPVVTSVVPASGPTTGGTNVTVSGSGFARVRAVHFGTVPATSFTVVSPSRIAAVAPPRRAGATTVTVTTALGVSARSTGSRFTYVEPPVVTQLTPSSGPAEGGTEVTIAGTGLAGATAVRFGERPAASFVVDSPAQIRAVSPPGPAGGVDVTVVTGVGASPPSAASRFTYVAFPEIALSFDELNTAGPQGGGARVVVDTEYQSRGVSFNAVTAVDYSKGPAAIPGFARSGTVGIEQCVGIELCMTPIRATFGAPQRLVRVWVGFSYPLNVPAQVRLRALDASSAVVGTATVTLPARATPTPIRLPLEIRLQTAAIRQFEVATQDGFTNGLALDDVTFQGG